MQIRAAMLEYMLARQGYHASLKGNGDAAVARVRAYREGAREAGTLYVADAGSSFPEPPGTAGFAIMQLDGDVSCAYDAMLALDAWDAALKDALIDGVSLEEFLGLGRDLLGCPLAYFDRDLIVLAASDDYWGLSASHCDSDSILQIEGQLPMNRALDLVEDIDYVLAADIQGGFYYEGANRRISYGINTFDQGEYLARLVFSLPKGDTRLHRGQEQLIDRFHELLDNLHLRYAGNPGIVSAQNDALHELARRVLLGAGSVQVTRDEASAVLPLFGWGYDDDYVVAQLVFFEGLHWNTVSLYLCGLLEHVMVGSCAFMTDRQIVWLVNLKRAARGNESSKETMKRFVESLVSVLRNYACKAGISNCFGSFSLARNAFKETVFALDIGQKRDPHYWYYMFRDYAMDYLLSKCSEDLLPAQVCHPALETLLAYDREHKTDYARTLVCFLRQSQNTTHAAEALYIHRTSLMRRMAQIAELTEIDLADPDQVLHLLLSAKLLGM